MGRAKQAGVAGGLLGLSAAAIYVISHVFAVEGGYVNDRNDPGGATNHGVTETVARNHGYRGNMRNLPKEFANEIYYKSYIEKPNFDLVIEKRLDLGLEIVDTGVNAGPARASRWFQESINLFNRRQKDYPDIKVDGQIGPATMRAYGRLERRRGKMTACQLVMRAMDSKQAAHYMRLGRNNSKFETFQVGWFRTRIRNTDCMTQKELRDAVKN